MQDVYAEILRMREQGLEGALVVVTDVRGHTPQVVGAKMIVRPDGSVLGTIGGGRVEHVVIERARAALAEGQASDATFDLGAELGMCCGGRMTVYIEPVVATDRLVLFGAGHVARATAQFAATCGFHVVVVDDREEWNSAARFPAPMQRVVEPHGDFLARYGGRATDYIVITTHNHDHDRDILGRSVTTAAGYVGMIGSTRKVHKTLKQLRIEGLDEAALARAHAPVGLDIMAETPEEIGIAIVGELIRHRRAERSRKKTRGATVRLLAEAQPSLVAEG